MQRAGVRSWPNVEVCNVRLCAAIRGIADLYRRRRSALFRGSSVGPLCAAALQAWISYTSRRPVPDCCAKWVTEFRCDLETQLCRWRRRTIDGAMNQSGFPLVRRWTPEEHGRLMEMALEGKRPYEIARALSRTEPAVRGRAHLYKMPFAAIDNEARQLVTG